MSANMTGANIQGVGARGPLGLSSLQVAMCVRARKFEPRALRMRDKRDHAVGMCLTGGLGRTLVGHHRMTALATPALCEAAEGLTAPVPLVVSVPEAGRPDDCAEFDAFPMHLAHHSGVAIDSDASRTVRCGHAGFAFALAEALELMANGHDDVLVGGVDSYYHPDVLAWLDRECRLHSLDAENGFVPSEGAAFVHLSKSPTKLARVTHLGTASDNDEPNVAAAITDLVAEALQSTSGQPWVLTDLNGERHRLREWSMVEMRLLPGGSRHDRWVIDLGDVGAASGAMFAAIACRMWAVGAGAGPSAVAALHSEGPERGVFVMEAAC